ncbi:cell division protein ZipA [Halomonas sp. SIMBA_159]
MELREWLIILGLALVSLIVVDGVRRLQRQRRVPRLDQAVKDLPTAKLEELDDEAKEAEINWELPNGGARVVKPADYSGLGNKPKLERQEHPGPSKVLSDFRRSFKKATTKSAPSAERAEPKTAALRSNDAVAEKSEPPRREPSLFATAEREAEVAKEPTQPAEQTPVSATRPTPKSAVSATLAPAPAPAAETVKPASQPQPQHSVPEPEPELTSALTPEPETAPEPSMQAESTAKREPEANLEPEAKLEPEARPELATEPEPVAAKVDTAPAEEPVPTLDPEPVLRAEPEDAVFAKHASDAPKRRQLRADTAGDHELDDDEIDEYRLVDFEGIGRSFKRRIIERRQEKAIKKAEKAKRAEAAAKQKAERKALEAEQRREAKQAAEAEKARIAQEKAQARDEAASEAAAKREAMQAMPAEPDLDRYEDSRASRYEEHYQAFDDEYDVEYEDEIAAQDNVVRAHPTLEKALRHDVNGEHAKETLGNADEMIVISVLSRDPDGFDGGKLLELMMACGLRYSRTMGVFHRFETESPDSELQFSMVNVLKPGSFPIEEMDEFVTPGITFLMPLPGAVDSSAAFEAMVETAMVVVRHMGGELKDENRSVMTAQTIEFARQRVHEFERRHRLHRHMQAR